ncbi:ferritin-like superfamily [Mycena polygramma]|nr:ferritin-like superfamily [Mycena polygramma]
MAVATQKRYVLYPLQQHKMWDLYKRAEARFWTAEDYSCQINATETRTGRYEMCTFLARVLTHNAKTAIDRLAVDLPYLEAKTFLTYQSMMRNIHCEIFGGLLETYIPTTSAANIIARDALLNAHELRLSNRKKEDWLQRTAISHPDIRTRLVAVACFETLIFSSCANAILKRKPEMLPKNLQHAMAHIHQDKQTTLDFLLLLYSHYADDTKEDTAANTIQQAVDLEVETIAGTVSYRYVYDILTHRQFRAGRRLEDDSH